MRKIDLGLDLVAIAARTRRLAGYRIFLSPQHYLPALLLMAIPQLQRSPLPLRLPELAELLRKPREKLLLQETQRHLLPPEPQRHPLPRLRPLPLLPMLKSNYLPPV